MREIKFRGKSNKYGWMYGNLSYREEDGNSAVFIEDQGFCGDLTPVERDTVGQYTGLKDANGEDIYEGDILDLYIPKNNVGKPEHRKRKVIWKDSGFQITNMHGDSIMDRVTSTIKLIYTIIGNIHDNPEMTEK